MKNFFIEHKWYRLISILAIIQTALLLLISPLLISPSTLTSSSKLIITTFSNIIFFVWFYWSLALLIKFAFRTSPPNNTQTPQTDGVKVNQSPMIDPSSIDVRKLSINQSIRTLVLVFLFGLMWFIFVIAGIMACDAGCSDAAGAIQGIGFFGYPTFIIGCLVLSIILFLRKEYEKLIDLLSFTKKYSLLFVFLPILTALLSTIF